MIEAGTILQQRYKIDKQIGQGGMGAVYVSTDERFGSVVAIKETLCNDDNFRKALEREARLLNSLKHAALPRVTDHFEENDGLFIVMEYIPGDDLSVILDRDGSPFSVEKVQDWAGQLLDALDFLHTQEIPVIHRDIKPQNLKLTDRGQIILLDFGLAKGNPTDAGHQTAAKSIFGYSRNYASLEQIQGTGTDPRSDIYSLSATLYHLITGVAPEDALTRAMAVLSQRPDPLAPANAIRAEVPAGFAGVLQKAMDLNADERPSSANEMRQMLANSGEYAYLAVQMADAQHASVNAPIDGQKTKIMPEGTMAAGARFTDLKTEVMSGDLSQVTSIKPAVTTDAPQPARRGFAFAAGGLGMLLVGGIVAGGLYVTKPEIFGSAPVVTSTEAPASPNALSNATENAPSLVDDQSTIVSNTNSTPPVDSPEKVKVADNPAKTSDTAKTGSQTPKAANLTDGETVITGTDDDGSPVTVKRSADGRTTTITSSEGTIVTRDGDLVTQRPAPPLPGRRPVSPPQGIDPSKLTPEQRRKLRILMNDPRFNSKPTPENP